MIPCARQDTYSSVRERWGGREEVVRKLGRAPLPGGNSGSGAGIVLRRVGAVTERAGHTVAALVLTALAGSTIADDMSGCKARKILAFVASTQERAPGGVSAFRFTIGTQRHSNLQAVHYGMYCRLLPGRTPPTTSIRAWPFTKTLLAATPTRAVGIGALVIHVLLVGS